MSEAAVWLNGELTPRSEATVSVYDRGFMSGDGVFETLKVIDGRPFAQTRHLARLQSSARLLGLPEISLPEIATAIDETIKANSNRIGSFGRLRITVSAGLPQVASIPGRGSESTMVITADPQSPHPESLTLISAPWVHNERGPLVGAKTTSYADNLSILEWARKNGADEALMADTQGRVCEATTANVVLVMNGVLQTPTLKTGCLGGVTRALLLEWGFVEELDVPFDSVSSASEILLASSTRDLIPVASLDGRAFEAPGALGAEVIAAFHANAAANPDP